MRKNRLGCLTGTGIFAALITAFVIAGFAFASGGRMFSPGSLNAIHGELLGGVTSHADIDGACNTCHVAPWESQTVDERCLVCHTDVPAQLVNVETPHGRMYALDLNAQCRDCHPEHRGAIASLTEIADWKYPHQLSGFSLDAHQLTAGKDAFQCADCHGNDVTTFDAKTCATCHGQMDQAFTANHLAVYGESCLSCHDGRDNFGRNFTHEGFQYKLMGQHKVVACENCHLNAYTLADFKTAPQDCISCHGKDDPHGGGLGPDCAACHTPDDWKAVQFDHTRTTFALTDAHGKVSCEKCHINNVFKDTPIDCFACHTQDDRHNGELGTDCGSCHKPTSWQNISFDHTHTAFPLTGRHANVLCASCHKNNQFKNTPTDCASCHVDFHQGQMGKNCAGCHSPNSWKDVIFDHTKTALPLTGAHKTVACASCHTNGVYKSTPSDCFSCHASKDVHNRQFGTDCASCHAPSDWKNVTFDHGKTAFPLNGMHVNLQCQSCHVNNVYKGTPKNCFACHASRDAHNGQFGTVCSACHTTTSWKNATFNHGNTAFPLADSHVNIVCGSCHVNNTYRGTPKNCFACHAAKDAHAGQFGTDCEACHTPTIWTDVSFNHNNTAFPLSGKHTNVLCVACHANGVYMGTPTTCVACHASRDRHNGQFGTNCGSCHNTSGWANVTFDHNNTNFPLIGHHSQLSCNSCHGNGVYQGTPIACIACHANKDKHNGQNGTDCALCHSPRDWGAIN